MTTSDAGRSLRNISLASYVGSAIEFYCLALASLLSTAVLGGTPDNRLNVAARL